MSAAAAADDASSDLERIHEFTSLVIASTRSPANASGCSARLGLGVSETNLGALRLINGTARSR